MLDEDACAEQHGGDILRDVHQLQAATAYLHRGGSDAFRAVSGCTCLLPGEFDLSTQLECRLAVPCMRRFPLSSQNNSTSYLFRGIFLG